MTGISPALTTQLRKTLISCGPFDSQQQLLAVFVDQRINSWRTIIASGDSQATRVDLTIAALVTRYNTQRENALVLLLRVLSERMDPGDTCHHELAEVADLLERELRQPAEAVPLPPVPMQATDLIQYRAGLNRLRAKIEADHPDRISTVQALETRLQNAAERVQRTGDTEDNRAMRAQLPSGESKENLAFYILDTKDIYSTLDNQLEAHAEKMKIIRELQIAKDADSIAILAQMIKNDDNINVRVIAIQALGAIGEASTVDFLTQTAMDTTAEVREASIRALVNMKQSLSSQTLRALLKDDDRNVRIATLKALALTDDLSFLSDLTYALNDGDPEICNAARSALEKFGTVEASAILTLWSQQRIFSDEQ